MAAIEFMKHRRISYVINSDGLVFDNGSFLKRAVRRHILKGAGAYLIAGEASIPSLRNIVGLEGKIKSYAMTSLTSHRVESLAVATSERDLGSVLVVGQYQDYKGLDVALDAAGELCSDLSFRFIGAGNRSEEFKLAVKKRGLNNVTIIPYLDEADLAKEYQAAGLFILPSRQECWGLVVNEAAACGCPVVSTWGSGAAIDYISQDYPELLAEPGDASSLQLAINNFYNFSSREKQEYSAYLIEKSASYTIEKMVEAHVELFSEIVA